MLKAGRRLRPGGATADGRLFVACGIFRTVCFVPPSRQWDGILAPALRAGSLHSAPGAHAVFPGRPPAAGSGSQKERSVALMDATERAHGKLKGSEEGDAMSKFVRLQLSNEHKRPFINQGLRSHCGRQLRRSEPAES